MVKLIMGLKGSGKTKQLVTDINEAVKNETGSMVCIEKGTKLRYDIDIRVRLPSRYREICVRASL